MKAKDIPIPERWPLLIRQAMLHAVSLAHFSIVCAWSRVENSKCYEANLKGKINRLQSELAQVKNQNRILISRFSRIPSRQRPYYSPEERMDILCHKAACGWKLKKTAKAFLTDEATISSWMKKIDNGTLVKIPVPWNKYPEYLRYASRKFKALIPAMGKKKISEYFVRSGLYLSAASVGRYLENSPPVSPDGNDTEASEADEKIKSIKSKHPGHIWNIDLTVAPTCGLWASWLPNALPQAWPFSWWLLVIVDHFSRKAVGFAVFKKQPSSEEVTAALDNAIAKNGRKPCHIISDKGVQFHCENYKNWCLKNDIKPRFGAVGKHGSIAITERFIKSLKNECTRKILVPFKLSEMRREMALYFTWYNEFRPHEYLNARTPMEVYNHSPPKETLKLIHGSEVPKMELEISYLDGRKHLPVIEFKKTA